MRQKNGHGRRHLSAPAMISLIICVITAMVWLSSYRWTFKLSRYNRPYNQAPLHTVEASIKSGRFIFARNIWGRGGDKEVEYEFTHFDADKDLSGAYDVNSTRMGFGWMSEVAPPDVVESSLQAVSIPFWFIVLCFGIYPAIAMWRRSVAREGVCRAYGYDLRVTPAQCPECGLTVERVQP